MTRNTKRVNHIWALPNRASRISDQSEGLLYRILYTLTIDLHRAVLLGGGRRGEQREAKTLYNMCYLILTLPHIDGPFYPPLKWERLSERFLPVNMTDCFEYCVILQEIFFLTRKNFQKHKLTYTSWFWRTTEMVRLVLPIFKASSDIC